MSRTGRATTLRDGSTKISASTSWTSRPFIRSSSRPPPPNSSPTERRSRKVSAGLPGPWLPPLLVLPLAPTGRAPWARDPASSRAPPAPDAQAAADLVGGAGDRVRPRPSRPLARGESLPNLPCPLGRRSGQRGEPDVRYTSAPVGQVARELAKAGWRMKAVSSDLDLCG